MAENMGFDLTDFIASVPDLDTGRQQIVYLPIEQIEPDPENFYSLDGIDELAGSIERLGLQQPLVVRPGADGNYVVISGHRRRAAILLIRDGGSQQFAEGVPCIIDVGEASDALRKLKLIMANSDTRKMTSADENKQAEQIEDLLRQLVDEGFVFPGRLREWVAKLSGMSRSKLNRLKVIRDHLAPGLKEKYYDKGEMNESVAYTLAQQPEDVQWKIVGYHLSQPYGSGIRLLTADEVPRYLERTRKLAELRCPVNKGGECINQQKMLEKIYAESWPPCHDCKTCCANCDRFTRCGNRCPLMDAKAKETRDAQREASKEERAKEKSQKEADIRTIEHIWARFGQALIGAGMTDKELRAMLNKGARNYKEFDLYMNDKRLESLLDFSCTDVKQNEYLPFHYSFRIDDFMRLVRIADALGVSLDYLFLRSDQPEGGLKKSLVSLKGAEPEPEEEEEGDTFVNFYWRWGDPPKDAKGWYVVKAKIGDDLTIRRVLFWNGNAWAIAERFGSPRIASEIEVVGWFPLPPDEEEQA